jgi:hypothetical protein
MSLLERRAHPNFDPTARHGWDSLPVPCDATEVKAARKRTGRILETLGISRRVVAMACVALERFRS